MITKIFNIEQGKVTPTTHCYILPELKEVIDNYQDNYVNVLAYCFYMACPYKSENPYADFGEEEKKTRLIKDFKIKFDTNNVVINAAISRLKDDYGTLMTRYLEGIRHSYVLTTEYLTSLSVISDGKTGNLSQIQTIQSKAGEAMRSYAELEHQVEEEKERNKTKNRANSKTGHGEL